MVAPTLLDMGYELVRVSVTGSTTPRVRIMGERTDGALIGGPECGAISHAVGAVLDVDDPIHGAWNLEVSSAGIDRPLTREKDWNRFSGHLARAETNIPIDGRKRFAGIVLGAEGGVGRMRVEDGSEAALPLAEIRKARLVLTDALIEASAQMAGVVHDADDPDAPQVPKLDPEKPVTRQADGRQTGARIGGARVGGDRTGRTTVGKASVDKAPPGKGPAGRKPNRKPH